MKTKAQRRSKGKGGLKRENGKLQELRDSVDNFVKSKGGSDKNKKDKRATFIKRKSRKLLRRETRMSKKARKKCHYMGLSSTITNESEVPAPKTTEKGIKCEISGVKPTGNLKTASQGPQETNDDNVITKDVEAKTKRKVHFSEDVKKERKKAKLEEGRKRALKDANIEEDKEIKRLEKRLGFNKRKKKNTLPQSFTNDGLDYILGILEPGASSTGLYESDEEMDIDKAKDNFNGLEEDSEGETTNDEKQDASEGDNDTDSEEEDIEVDLQLEDVEDLEDSAQLDEDEEEAEDDEEQSDTDASEANDDGEEVESEQRPPDSKEPVCHTKSVSISFIAILRSSRYFSCLFSLLLTIHKSLNVGYGFITWCSLLFLSSRIHLQLQSMFHHTCEKPLIANAKLNWRN